MKDATVLRSVKKILISLSFTVASNNYSSVSVQDFYHIVSRKP